MNYHFTGIAGAPISLLAVLLLVIYTRRYETRTDAITRMREVQV